MWGRSLCFLPVCWVLRCWPPREKALHGRILPGLAGHGSHVGMPHGGLKECGWLAGCSGCGFIPPLLLCLSELAEGCRHSGMVVTRLRNIHVNGPS